MCLRAEIPAKRGRQGNEAGVVVGGESGQVLPQTYMARGEGARVVCATAPQKGGEGSVRNAMCCPLCLGLEAITTETAWETLAALKASKPTRTDTLVQG